MSNSNKQRLSLPGALKEPTTALIEQLPVETSVLTQEKQMEQAQSKWVGETDQSQAPLGPTAKQMAAVEEENTMRLIKQANDSEVRAQMAAYKPEPLISVAAKGIQAVHDSIRAHAQKPAKPPYTPPPMTERQKQALREEMEAGARRVAQNAAQHIRAGHPLLPPAKDANEGVTTPVHRPGDHVPSMAKMELIGGR